MTRLPTGGAGPKRRQRTMLRQYANVIVVGLNRSSKRLPTNWRELLADSVKLHCATPPRHFFVGSEPPQSIARPVINIASFSLPGAPVLFVLDPRSDATARQQRRIIDYALSLCDVTFWPVPKVTVRKGAGGETFVATNLYLQDTFVGQSFNRFNPHLLRGLPDVDWRHLSQYTARKGKAEFLGIRTNCGQPCPCRRILPDVWHIGWELLY